MLGSNIPPKHRKMLPPDKLEQGQIIRIHAISKKPTSDGLRSAYTAEDYLDAYEEEFFSYVTFTVQGIYTPDPDQDLCRTDGKLVIGNASNYSTPLEENPITLWMDLEDKFELIGVDANFYDQKARTKSTRSEAESS